jgi:dienelactone hydrolase
MDDLSIVGTQQRCFDSSGARDMIKRFIPLAAIALAVSSAWAAPVPGADGAAFYNVPTPIPAGAHGELLTYRAATVKLGTAAPASKAWTVMYKTKDADDADQVSTGTVIVPASGAPAGVVLYAVGTHGLGSDCAPSKHLVQGVDYENVNIAAALKEGYAVLVTDYVGYTNGNPVAEETVTPRYMAGPSQGRNVLDIFKAATMIPGVGFSSTAKVAIWGYSQGGQASSFAAQLQPTYAPGMSVVGVATGGVPGDFIETANYLNGKNGSAFLFQTVLGLYEEYPFDIPFVLAVSDSGEQAVNVLRTECVFKALFKYQNKNITEYTNPGWDLAKMLALGSVKGVMDEQKLGQVKINFPVYQYHGAADQFIPLGQAFELKKRWCANGTNVKFDLYPSEHIATQFQGGTPALAWLKQRFAGQAAQSSCSTSTAPVGTANPNTGNMVVTMKEWPLAATVKIKGLNQTVTLPANSSFTADADINGKTLKGNLNVPDFKQSLKILGIGAQVGLKIAPVGDTTGTVSLDDQGILRVKGEAKTDITVTSVWGIPFGVCKTQAPVVFPLNYEGPISGLGTGLTFAGTTTFPPIKGCIISAIISALMSGSGQEYAFTVSPPAPKAN